jgi:hypothetical protein
MRYDWQFEEVDYLGKSKSSRKKGASSSKKKDSHGYFRPALLLAYRLEYGATDQQGIAQIIDEQEGDMSAGRLSQILSDRDKLKHETVRKILNPIKSEDNRRDVLLAYLKDVFSIRTDHVVSEDVFGGTVTEDKVAALRELFAMGRYQRVMWAAYAGTQSDATVSLKYRLYLLGIRSAFRLDRPGSGLGFVRNWLVEASQRGEDDVIATCHYHRAQLLFASGVKSLEQCLAINYHAQMVLSRLPVSFTTAYRGLVVDSWQLDAQRIGMQITHFEKNPKLAEQSELNVLLKNCQGLIQSSPTEQSARMSQGLLARIEFVSGKEFRALDDLDDAKSKTIKEAQYRHDDWMLARARSLRISEEPESAEEFVVEAIAQIRYKENRFHYRMLDLELALIRDQEIDDLL